MKQFTVRVPDELAQAVDKARGMVKREPFIRDVLERYIGFGRYQAVDPEEDQPRSENGNHC